MVSDWPAWVKSAPRLSCQGVFDCQSTGLLTLTLSDAVVVEVVLLASSPRVDAGWLTGGSTPDVEAPAAVEPAAIAAALKRPTLVGWSFGTRIIADYLLKYGAGRIAAINLVAPILSQDPSHFGPGIEHVMKARDDDYVTSVTATRAFLRSCFAKQPAQEEFETMLVFNANVPVKVRQWMRRASSDADVVQAMLKSLDLPVLITHGVKDQLPSVRLSQWLATIIPRARLSLYQEAGHAPFFEEPARFNRELAELVRDAKSDRSDVG
jgi:pimeloyl-ACP methyl ester carboxylesterase